METTYVAVDLYDELTFERSSDARAVLTWEDADSDPAAADFDTGEGNLIMRAVRLVERECHLKAGVKIHLLKRIPIAAGLGGGSADAAATLAAMNRLYSLDSPRERLAEWGAELGSDVPFFLGPPCAFATGRGERLQSRAIFTSWWVVLACPRVALPTPEVYAALDLTSPKGFSHVPDRLDGEGFFATLGRIHNDLEPVVIRRVPQVSYWRTQLQAMGAKGVYVSGSGPSVFGVFAEPPDQERVRRAGREDVRLFILRPVQTPMALVIG